MGLEYRGSRVSEDQDIIRLLDARATAQQVTSSADAQAVIDSGITGLANKSYVDSAFGNFATQADLDVAYNDRLPKTALGTTVAQLNSSGKIPPSLLPTMTTRGAVWCPGGVVNQKLDYGGDDTYWTTSLSSVWINAAWVGNRPYYAMGFAQIEVKGNFGNSNPVIYISQSSTSPIQSIATGHGIPGWIDYYHLTAVPTTADASAQTFTGSRYFYLTANSFGASSDFTSYYPSWGVLLIPTTS